MTERFLSLKEVGERLGVKNPAAKGYCLSSNKSAWRDTVSLYWISLFLWFDYATSPTKRYRPFRPYFY